MKTFTDYAVEKMMDLYKNHSDEVGSTIASSYKNKRPTDCITYVINVLMYAFEKSGQKSVSEKVQKLGAKGTELAAYLVKDQKWAGIYYNPDVNHPRDGNAEHPLSQKKVLESKKYYEIPVSCSVINYKPTRESDPNYKSWVKLGGSKKTTEPDDAQLKELKKVQFAVGISKGGVHTWLYSLGQIYEVHWDKIGDDLYEASKFEDYQYISGTLVIPPDALAAAKFCQTWFDSFWEWLFGTATQI